MGPGRATPVLSWSEAICLGGWRCLKIEAGSRAGRAWRGQDLSPLRDEGNDLESLSINVEDIVYYNMIERYCDDRS